MKIDVFCEWGKQYGLGHLKRCENLIQIFQQTFPMLHFHITFHHLPSQIPTQAYDLVIIDSYLMESKLYYQLSKLSKAMLCLDDFHRIHYPKKALILSPTLLSSSKYSGKDHVILNPIFQAPLSTQQIPNQVLITLGGSDQSSLIRSILDSLPSFFDPIIINPYFPKATYANLSSKEICALIDRSEYIITAGGGSLNEAISRNKKIIAICIAPNQKPQLNAYKNRIPILFNPFSDLSSKLGPMLKTTQPLHISFGAKLPKLAQTLLYRSLQLPHNIKPFTLLTRFEKKQVLKLRNQQEIREASFYPHLISLKEHLHFIDSLQPSDMYFAFFRGRHIAGVGSLCLTSTAQATLSLYRDKKAKGFGNRILLFLTKIAQKLEISTLTLQVLKSNQKAINFYRKHHFQITQENQNHFTMQKEIKNP